MASIANFAKEIAQIQQSPAYQAVIQIFQANPHIKACTITQLEGFSSELNAVAIQTRVPELSSTTIGQINESLSNVSASYSRVAELKMYFMRLHLEWRRYFPIIYAKFDDHEWVKTFRNKETRQAIIAEVFGEYHTMAELSKFLVEKCDIVLDQFRTFTFNLRDQRENLKLECQFFMANNVKHPDP